MPTVTADVFVVVQIGLRAPHPFALVRGDPWGSPEGALDLFPTIIGDAEPCPRLLAGVARSDDLAAYRSGRPLEEAVSEAHLRSLLPTA